MYSVRITRPKWFIKCVVHGTDKSSHVEEIALVQGGFTITSSEQSVATAGMQLESEPTPMFIAALFIIARTWKQPR